MKLKSSYKSSKYQYFTLPVKPQNLKFKNHDLKITLKFNQGVITKKVLETHPRFKS